MRKFMKLFLLILVFLGGIFLFACTNEKEDAQTNEDNETLEDTTHIHQGGDWVVVSEATCQSAGEKKITCTVCGKVLSTEEIPALDHTLEYYKDEEATCSEVGHKLYKCSVCGEIVEGEEIEKISHTVVIDEAVAASCTKTGLTEGSHCSVCGEVIVMQYATPLVDHDYVVVENVDATDTTSGYTIYECSMCGDSYTVNIPSSGVYNNEEEVLITLSDLGSSVSNNNGGVTIDGATITISKAGEYVITGELLEGNIVISVGDEDEVDLVLNGMTLASSTTDPIYMENGDKLEISAKNGTKNVIKDLRTTTTDATGAAIYALCDMLLKGKGELEVSSTYNNGIHTKDDLKIKNLTLTATAVNNAIKGNDSITIESGIVKAISSGGDALKTSNSSISSKGNQKGTITISGGAVDLYATTDGIDAAYDAIIEDGLINIYTDKFSSYSGDVTVTSSSTMYLKLSNRSGLSSSYRYSALFYDEEGNTTWCSGTQATTGREAYFKFTKPSDSVYVKFYCYSSSQTSNQDTNYLYATDKLTINSSKDAYNVTTVSNKIMSGSWTNYTTQSGQGGFGGHGGMQEGNSDKTDYSCKGIKADNEVIINGGTINIQSTDDGIHANNDTKLETGSYGAGNVTINGGNITIYTLDDGIHADSNNTIAGGNIIISNSYEGVEGNVITFSGGSTQIASSDDGVNAKTTLNINDGFIYMNANGDGIDSNNNVYMTGGVVLAQGPTNGGNGVIDFERSFSFSGGLLLAIGCSGMNQKPTATSGNTSTSKSISTTTSSYVNVVVNSTVVATIKVTKGSQNYCVLAYNNTLYPSASVSVTTSNSNTLVNNLYYVK